MKKGEVKFLVTIDAHGKPILKEVDKGFEDIDRTARKTGSTLKSLRSNWLAITAAMAAGVFAIAKLVSAARGWVQLAGVQEKAEKNLESVLRATGEAAGYNLGQLKAMAAEYQNLTGIGDEVILGGMSVLATFKKISGEGFERATRAALDMQAVMGGPLQSSIVMIGKSMNDPIANLSAMSRSGVQFTKHQRDMVKTLWESGNVLGAQNIILKELESQFGGAAAAARETFAVSVDAAGNALGDMKEELGFVITKNQFFVDLMHIAEDQFKQWGAQIRDNRTSLQALAKSGVLKVADGIIFAVKTMKFFHNAWLGIRLVANKALEGIAWLLEKDIKILRVLLKPLDMIFDGLVKLGTIDVNPFDSLEWGVAQFRESSADVTKEILSDIEKTNTAYNTVIGTLDEMRRKIGEVSTAQKAVSGGKAASVSTGGETGTGGKELSTWEKDIKAAKDLVDSHDLVRASFTSLIDKEKDYAAVKQAVKGAIVASILGYESFGVALKKAAAQMLATKAAEAAIQALYQAALGFAALAVYDTKGAALHFKSAAMFAAITVAAGAAAKAMMASAGGASSGAKTGYEESQGAGVESLATEGEPQQYAQQWDVTIVNPIGTEEWVEDNLVPALAKVANRDTEIIITYGKK